MGFVIRVVAAEAARRFSYRVVLGLRTDAGSDDPGTNTAIGLCGHA